METKQDLQKKALDGDALSGLKATSGFVIFIDMLKDMYKDSLELVEAGDNPDARATIKVIKAIVNKIDDTINLGEQAKQELEEGLFAPNEG